MGFPRVDQHGLLVRQRHQALADQEMRVVAFSLQQDVAMGVGVPDEPAIHVEQGHSSERTMGNLDRLGHRPLYC